MLPPILLGVAGGSSTLAALVAFSGMIAVERYRAATQREISRAREERLTELERVRRRIAADLHDEIGSSLTQISILSEVARQQGAGVVPELNRPLGMIATASRELVDTMSDIVWRSILRRTISPT